MIINVHYGVDSMEKTFDRSSISVGEVLGNQTIKLALGFGDNVKGMVAGVEVPSSAILEDGDHLHVEVKANSKAVTRHEVQRTMAIVELAIKDLSLAKTRLQEVL